MAKQNKYCPRCKTRYFQVVGENCPACEDDGISSDLQCEDSADDEKLNCEVKKTVNYEGTALNIKIECPQCHKIVEKHLHKCGDDSVQAEAKPPQEVGEKCPVMGCESDVYYIGSTLCQKHYTEYVNTSETSIQKWLVKKNTEPKCTRCAELEAKLTEVRQIIERGE